MGGCDRMEKVRDSRFELLRIIAITIIVLYHFSMHTSGEALQALSVNQIIYSLYHIGGKLGVDLFVLITGYFSIRSTFRLKKIVDLEFHVLFYTLLFLAVYLVCVVVGVLPFSLKMVVRSVLPVSFNAYWFVTAYIGMFLFSPFINVMVSRLSMRQYMFLLAAGSVVFTLIPTFFVQRQLVNDLLFFIYMYLLGGFIRIYWEKLDNKFSAAFLRGAVVLLTLILWLSAVVLTVAATHVKAVNGHEYYFHFEYSTPVLLLALAIIMLIAKQKPYKNKMINQIAKMTFGVYLIQSNPIIATYMLWEWLAGFKLHQQPLWGLYALLITAALIVVSMVIEKGRLLLFQHFKPTKIYQLCDRLESYFELSLQK